MMVKGEGGAKRISEGCQWLEKAAAKGHKNAQVILDKMSNYEVHTQMINLTKAVKQIKLSTRDEDGKHLSRRQLFQLLETAERQREAALSENNLLAACDTVEEGEDRPVITLADGTTVYYVEDTGLCYSTNGGIQPLGSYNSDTNSLEELNLTP
jgi:hypothetical protein